MGEAARAGRLPASYRPATWRNTTPADVETGLIGIGFDLPDGQVLRLALPLEGASYPVDLADLRGGVTSLRWCSRLRVQHVADAGLRDLGCF